MNPLTTLALVAAPILAVPAVTASTPTDAPKNIVETALEAGNFKTLLAAAKAADLVAPLVGEGPLTVLAPTDDAFAALGGDTIADLLKPENKDTLARILKYHVIAGAVGSTDALKAESAPTLAGPEVSFGLENGRLLINGEVNVVANDIETSNGIIHVIDAVLIPEPEQPPGRLVIGFFSESPGAQLANYLGVDRHSCRLVTDVTSGSEAEKAGLAPYDLILTVNGREATEDSIAEVKGEVGFGGTVKLQVLRRGEHMTITSKVGVDH